MRPIDLKGFLFPWPFAYFYGLKAVRFRDGYWVPPSRKLRNDNLENQLLLISIHFTGTLGFPGREEIHQLIHACFSSQLFVRFLAGVSSHDVLGNPLKSKSWFKIPWVFLKKMQKRQTDINWFIGFRHFLTWKWGVLQNQNLISIHLC